MLPNYTVDTADTQRETYNTPRIKQLANPFKYGPPEM